MGLHVFVAMPCGLKQNIDFDAVYTDYLRPALENAGLVAYRADEVQRAGDLPADLFQELLQADLIIVDQTLNTPDVWYDINALSALRARGVLRVQRRRSFQPSDMDTSYTLHYHVADGHPDPDYLALDRQSLADAALAIVASLNGRPGTTQATPGERVVRREAPWQPRRVFLFSGHMIDTPNRARPRFPANREGIAARAIAAKLDELGMGERDLALCGGACGGDLLFAEAALQRNCRLHLHLQYPEAEFLKASVAFAGTSWVGRYYAVKGHALTRIRCQPDELGPPAKGINPYVRNNLWQLYTALSYGTDKLRFVGLWNGDGSTDPGGTQNMVETVRRYAGKVSILDTRLLFGL